MIRMHGSLFGWSFESSKNGFEKSLKEERKTLFLVSPFLS
jgi:hypothetical protein